MKHRIMVKLVPKDIVTYILLILCLLGCNTVYSTCATKDYRFPELTALFLIILLVLNIKHLSFSILKKWILFFLPYYFLNIVIIMESVSSDKLISFSVKFLIFIPLLTLIILNDARKGKIWNIILKFENIIYIYVIITLILWIFVCFFNIIPMTGEIVSSWGGERVYPLYFGIFTTRQTQEFLGILWTRNQGIFAEGPMYNLVLIIAICIEVFIAPIQEKKGKFIWNGMDMRKLIILIITDITTFTITGMILLLAIFSFKYCLTKSKTVLVGIIKWVGAIIVLIMAGYFSNKLFLVKADTGSWEVRFDDFLAGFAAWKRNFWFGNGYDTMDAITYYMSSRRSYNMGYSSGMFSVLAQGGIALMLNYIIAFVGYIKYSVQFHRYELISMSIIVILIFITSLFHFTFVMLLILAYGYALLIHKFKI